MTIKEKMEAARLLGHISQYVQHKSSCSLNLYFSDPASDYCDCEFNQVRTSCTALLELLRKQ